MKHKKKERVIYEKNFNFNIFYFINGDIILFSRKRKRI
nr:MAG TPA: hypothetical protein [Caudoviricetes sp.]